MKAEYETKLNNQRKEMLANSDMSKDEQQMMDEIYTLKQKSIIMLKLKKI